LATGNLFVASTPTYQGGDELEAMVNAGLTTNDENGRPVALLAERIPTVENGLLLVFPDGRMETRWNLRKGITWHDGASFTAADLLFTAELSRIPELPF